jgi:hypothetical protein
MENIAHGAQICQSREVNHVPSQNLGMAEDRQTTFPVNYNFVAEITHFTLTSRRRYKAPLMIRFISRDIRDNRSQKSQVYDFWVLT